MRILFCIYRLDFADHISLSYLSAIAKQRGHETYFCVLKDFESTLARVHPDLVAYSLNIFGFAQVVAAHKRVRDKYQFLSIAGGPQCSFDPGQYPATGFDAYCIGEGEGAWAEFLSRVEAGTSYADVQNLVTAQGANPVRPWIADLDTIPFPDRDLVLSNSFLQYTPKKTFYATRGCPFSCYYCVNNYYNQLYRGKGKVIRRFSVDRIIEEIKYVRSKYRMEFIKFGDDLFAFKPDAWMQEFSRRYGKEIGVPFNCYLRFDWATDDLLKLLKSAGCHSVHLSVDSTSELVREQVLGRKMRKIDVVQQLQKIRSYDIYTLANFLLAAPESTLADDLETIEVARKSNLTFLGHSTTTPIRGTRLYDYAVSHNMLDMPNYDGQDLAGFNKPSQLTVFLQREKDARYNIYLLGGWAAKLPSPFRQAVVLAIKWVRPNAFFVWLRRQYYNIYFQRYMFDGINKRDKANEKNVQVRFLDSTEVESCD